LPGRCAPGLPDVLNRFLVSEAHTAEPSYPESIKGPRGRREGAGNRIGPGTGCI